MKKLIFLLLLIISFEAYSANVLKATGQISKIRTFAKNYTTYDINDVGLTVIYVDTLTGACDSDEKRVAISTDHPLYQSVVSKALMAKASNLEIEVWHLDTCTQRNNAWDFGLIDLP